MLNIFQKFYKNSLIDRKFNEKHQYWSQLRMFIQNFFKINPAVFKMKCGTIEQTETPSSFILRSRCAYKITHKANNPNSH
jgi:hypothetical protein